MPEAMRLNLDTVANGGLAVATPVQGVYLNGELAMVVGGFVTAGGLPPMESAGPAPMVEGSPSVFIEGKPVCRVGDLSASGSACASGSPDIFINEP